jgi:ABC-type Zn2+ transport system substrate-binding protein/surface adhesin
VHDHGNGHAHAHGQTDHEHSHTSHSSVEAATPPTRPSQAVMLDIGVNAGALVLRSSAQRAGLEVEIHPESAAERRQHVWVLPREGRDGATVYAAVFASLSPGRYTVLEPDGSAGCTLSVPANQVTYGEWDGVVAPFAIQPVGAA